MNLEQKKFMGRRIKECRNKLGISQEELAEMLGMKRTNIANYEAGRVVPPGNILVKLSDIFGVSTDYILGLSDSPNKDFDELDDDLRQIQRYKRKLTNEIDRKRLAKMIENIKLSFIDAFNEEEADKEDEEDI